MIVAIDGPSGAGKTSASREVARRLGFRLLDTGALYRGAAWLAARAGIDVEDGPAVARLIEGATFEFRDHKGRLRLFIDGADVSRAIRTPKVSEAASKTSAVREVRSALLGIQRALGRRADCVVEGRDIGTVVFPDADHKFFLSASVDERVRRRRQQYLEQGREVSEADLRREVIERDARDASRALAPLVAADDAIVLDSTELSLEEVVGLIVRRVKGADGTE